MGISSRKARIVDARDCHLLFSMAFESEVLEEGCSGVIQH
jgi:hypothetical protein